MFKDFIEDFGTEERTIPESYEPTKRFINFVKALEFEMDSNYNGLTENVTKIYEALALARSQGKLESKNYIQNPFMQWILSIL